ncbi:MAG: NADH:ubiquinone reductase (Na(+)-transporting) subunit C [Planctomycetota bacterium]
MSNTNSNGYTMVFAIGMCVVVSSVLALLANVLKPMQLAAKEFDRQKNVMRAAGLIEVADPRPREELEQLFKDRIVETIIDTDSGEPVTDAEEAAKKRAENPLRYRSVATSKDEAGKQTAVILPISGKGLWSTIKGYLALEADQNTVKGVTFYEHGETPGLGGEVENPQWTGQWVGKKILGKDGALVSIIVKKGQVDDGVAREKRHYVDGLAGATITSNGVTKFVKRDIKVFAAYLEKNGTRKQ